MLPFLLSIEGGNLNEKVFWNSIYRTIGTFFCRMFYIDKWSDESVAAA